jgi:hypothetical protein
LIGGILGGFVLLAGIGIYYIYRRNRTVRSTKSWDETLASGETHVRSTTTQGTMEEVEPAAEEQEDSRPRRGGRLRYNYT